MTTDHGKAVQQERSSEIAVETTIVPSCTERDFFDAIYPYARYGNWACVYCGEPVEYQQSGTVYIGAQRLECTIENLGGFFQLAPKAGAPVAVNRCCSDRIAGADHVIPIGRQIHCPVCDDTYLSAMVSRWQGSSQVQGYLRDGRGYAVDKNLAVPALVPVERLSGGPR
jgi:hypothetical protein